MSDMFNDLVARKTQQQQIRIQTAQSTGQTLDIVQEQLQMEQAQYDQLNDAGVAAAPLQEVEKQRLAPGIETTGMNDKHATKVKTRTLKNLKKGRTEVGQMATSQTIPLMRSMRRNAKALREEREKEVTDISALANLVIPADIFDVALTKEHSHFDVKKALLIREQLRKIADFKENNPNAYTMLDFDVYTKLELLLDEKDAYETTLRTVLAANGLTETGEKATDQEIHDAREKYYIIKDSYRETMESHDANLAALVTAEKAKRSKALYDPKAQMDKKQAMVRLLTSKWDGELREKDGNWMPLTESFMMSEYYDRAVYRMDPDNEEASYKIMQSAICAYRLTSTELSDKERDVLFKKIQSEICPVYNEFRKKLPEIVARLEKANFEELLEMAPEILEFELPTQHISDILKRCSDSQGVTLEASLGMSKEELDNIRRYKTFLSSVKKRIILINGIRAGQAGIPIKHADLDSNLHRVTEHLADTNGNIDPSEFAQYLQRDLKSNLETISGISTAELKKQKKTHEEKKAEYEHYRDMTAEIEADKVRLHDQILARAISSGMNDQRVDQSKAKPVDFTQYIESFKKTGLKLNVSPGSLSPDEVIERDFKALVREILGSGEPDFSMKEGRLETSIVESYLTLEDLEKLVNVRTEADMMKFLQPLFDFDPVAMFNRFDKATLEDLDKRFDTVARCKAEVAPLLALKQFSARFLVDGYLSPEATQKLIVAMNRFDITQRTIIGYAAPYDNSVIETSEIDVPQVANLMDCIDRAKEFKTVKSEAVSSFVKDHPLVSYSAAEATELEKLGFSPSAILGAQKESDGTVLYPVSKEQVQKISSGDTSLIRELSEKISSFTFINETGRARVLFNSDAKDLASYGTEDLKYYGEMALNARLLLAAEQSNSAAVKEVLGKETQKVLQTCKRLIALQKTITDRLGDQFDQMPSYFRADYMNGCRESHDALAAKREEEILAHEEERERLIRKNATL